MKSGGKKPMDDKLFDLMTKMYSEMQEMKADIKETKADLKETKADLKADINKIYIKIEHDIEPKLGALFDGYKQTFELEKENSKKLDDIADKVSKQEVEIKVIQGGKK